MTTQDAHRGERDIIHVTAKKIDGWWVVTLQGTPSGENFQASKTVKVRTLDNINDVVRDSWNVFNSNDGKLTSDFDVNITISSSDASRSDPIIVDGVVRDLSKTPGEGVFYPVSFHPNNNPSTQGTLRGGNVGSGGNVHVHQNGAGNLSGVPKMQVECEDLTVAYNNGDVIAVDKLNLKVSGGVVVGILGGNGAGKTSTLRTFGGVIPPTSGVLKIGGHLMSSKKGAELARKDLGYCPDTGGLIRQATIREHIGVALALRNMEESWPDALNLVEKFGLTRFIDRQTGSFSHGMSRRLSVLLAVLTSRTVLVLDEPFDGVDPLGVEATEDSIRVAAEQGLGVVVSTHLLSLLSKVSDNICVMSEGKIIAEENAEVFLSTDGEKYYETLLRNAHKKVLS